MSLVADLGSESPSVTVRPEHGRPVTFTVSLRRVNVATYGRNYQQRWVVGLKGSSGEGFSTHVMYDRAVAACLSRARRYERAFSKPVQVGGAA